MKKPARVTAMPIERFATQYDVHRTARRVAERKVGLLKFT